MRKGEKPNSFFFIAALEDGSEHWFAVDRLTLQGGDEVARVVALERQRKGTLPAGKIESVRRANALDFKKVELN